MLSQTNFHLRKCGYYCNKKHEYRTSFKPKDNFWKHRYRGQEENVQNVTHHSNKRRSSGNMVTEFMYKMWDFKPKERFWMHGDRVHAFLEKSNNSHFEPRLDYLLFNFFCCEYKNLIKPNFISKLVVFFPHKNTIDQPKFTTS